jgi:hypothetical protein
MSGASKNNTAIFETPEQGVAAYWQLLVNYREAGAFTVENIIKRYGGGQDYSSYVDFVVGRSGFSKNTEIDLDNDVQLLRFAKPMFMYESGVAAWNAVPIKDEQILFGFDLGRKNAARAVS